MRLPGNSHDRGERVVRILLDEPFGLRKDIPLGGLDRPKLLNCHVAVMVLQKRVLRGGLDGLDQDLLLALGLDLVPPCAGLFLDLRFLVPHGQVLIETAAGDSVQDLRRAVAHVEHVVREDPTPVKPHAARKATVLQRFDQLRYRVETEGHELVGGALVLAGPVYEDVARAWVAHLLPVLIAELEDQFGHALLDRQLVERLDGLPGVRVVFLDHLRQQVRRFLGPRRVFARGEVLGDVAELLQQFLPRDREIAELDEGLPHAVVRDLLRKRVDEVLRRPARLAQRNTAGLEDQVVGLKFQPVGRASPRQDEHLAALARAAPRTGAKGPQSRSRRAFPDRRSPPRPAPSDRRRDDPRAGVQGSRAGSAGRSASRDRA